MPFDLKGDRISNIFGARKLRGDFLGDHSDHQGSPMGDGGTSS